jgi:protein-tyrosine phosphatase
MAAATCRVHRQQQQRTPSPLELEIENTFRTINDAERFAKRVGRTYQKMGHHQDTRETRGILRELNGRAVAYASGGRQTDRNALIREAIAHPDIVLQYIPAKKAVALRAALSVTKAFPEVRAQALDTPLCLKRPLDEICPHLFLGELGAYAKLREKEICYIVNATLDHVEAPDSVKVLKVGAPDSALEWKRFLDTVSGTENTSSKEVDSWFEQTFDFIDEALKEQKNILVHCAAGVSRSATLVVAYLMSRKGLSLDQAMATVYQKRPWIRPNAGFMQLLKTFEGKLKQAEGEKKEAPVANALKPLDSYEKAVIIGNEKGGALVLGRSQDYPKLIQEHQRANKTLRVIHFHFRDDSALPKFLPKEVVHDVTLDEGNADDGYWKSMLTALKREAPSQHVFESLFTKIDQWLLEGKQVFVQCTDSFDSSSFSSSLVIAYLMDRFHLPFEKAIAFAKSKYPLVNLNYQFREGLSAWEHAQSNHLPFTQPLTTLADIGHLMNDNKLEEGLALVEKLDEHSRSILYSQLVRIRRNLEKPLPEGSGKTSFHQQFPEAEQSHNARLWELVKSSRLAYIQLLLEGLKEAEEHGRSKEACLYYAILCRVDPDFCEEIEQETLVNKATFRDVIHAYYREITE